MNSEARPGRDGILEKIRVRLVEYASSKGMRDRADDVAQETLVVLWSKYSHVAAEGDLVPLAYRICKFKMLEARRDLSRAGSQLKDELPIPDPAPGIQGQLEKEEFGRRLKTAVTELSERCKTLIRLRLEEKTTAEIAKLLGVPEGTIYVWEYRCRKALFEKLA